MDKDIVILKFKCQRCGSSVASPPDMTFISKENRTFCSSKCLEDDKFYAGVQWPEYDIQKMMYKKHKPLPINRLPPLRVQND